MIYISTHAQRARLRAAIQGIVSALCPGRNMLCHKCNTARQHDHAMTRQAQAGRYGGVLAQAIPPARAAVVSMY